MIDFIRGWILGISAAAFITAMALTVSPKGPVKNLLRFLCGLLMLIMLIKPFIGASFGDFSIFFQKYGESAAVYSENLEKENDRLTQAIIEEQLAAYILDKAEALGAKNIRVKVKAEEGEDGGWLFTSELSGILTFGQKTGLSDYLEKELGIAKERQNWSTEDENEMEP